MTGDPHDAPVGHGLGSMTTEEVLAAAPKLLLVPLGATEQHGPHLPLSTDTDVAIAWAERVADSLNSGDPEANRPGAATTPGSWAVVAPALPYGSSGEHQSFPGTLSIGQEALSLLIVELARSAAHDFDEVVLLSGHAGNLAPVEQAVEQLRAEGHKVRHFVPVWSPADIEAAGIEAVDAHAGRTETSLMRHLHPSDVRDDLVAPGQTRPLSELLDTMVADGVGAVAQTGVLGDPTGATAAEGQRLLDLLVAKTVAAIRLP